jgi:biotin synthase-related radical SAM superfamily protein
MIHVSVGTAGVLGLAEVPMAAAPTTAYLMLGGRCAMNCGFCAQARDSTASEIALSRVLWPEYPLEEVCQRLRDVVSSGEIHRCCIQVTTSHDSFPQTLAAVRQLREAVPVPINVAVLPADLHQAAALIEAGVERIGWGLDAASEPVFREVKGKHWRRMLDMIERMAARYPGRASIHLVVGLGETERELVSRVIWARDLGIGVGLFAFTPIRGTALEGRPPPSLGRYRRMQAASWLVLNEAARITDFEFGDSAEGPESLIGIRLSHWRERLAQGSAFRTLGCPDCNRPYYNERPGGVMYNYPRPLSAGEMRQAIMDLGIGESPDGT